MGGNCDMRKHSSTIHRVGYSVRVTRNGALFYFKSPDFIKSVPSDSFKVVCILCIRNENPVIM